MMFSRGFRSFGGCFEFGRGIFGGGWFMPLFMILLTIIVIVAAVLIIKRINKSSNKNAQKASIEELKIEFAKGKLTEEEYLRKKRILSE